MKKLILPALFSLALVATGCNDNKTNTQDPTSGVTQEQMEEEASPEMEEPENYHAGEGGGVISDERIESPAPANVTTQQASTPTHYVSEDGKTKFVVTYTPDTSAALVTNQTTGESYNMKPASTASGSRLEDGKGNYFESHQGEFSFGKNGKDIVKGKETK